MIFLKTTCVSVSFLVEVILTPAKNHLGAFVIKSEGIHSFIVEKIWRQLITLAGEGYYKERLGYKTSRPILENQLLL